MATYTPPKKHTAWRGFVTLRSQADPNLFQANPTLATGDVKVSIDGAAFANLTTLPAVTPAAGKAVQVDLSLDEMNGDNITVLFSDAAGAEWADLALTLQTAANQYDDLGTSVAAIKAKTDNLPASPSAVGSAMALTSGERNSVADALLDRAAGVETGVTTRQGLRLLLAGMVGKLSGAATSTVTIRDTTDTTNRVVATVDASGNRTAVTLDAS